MQQIDDLIGRVTNLPPAPQILPELLPLLDQSDIDADRVVRLLTHDPGLTANLLRLANSALLGGSRPAENLAEAITRLGFRRVYELVVAMVGARMLGSAQTGYGMISGELWKHSLGTALAARCLAQDVGENETAAFTAGLLHDTGKLVLSEALAGKYEQIVEETERNRRSMLEAEEAIVGAHHAQLGGRLLERWKLPPSLVGAVRHHHAPSDAAGCTPLAAIVYLGNMVAHCMGYCAGYQSFALRGRAEVFGILNLDPERWPVYIVRTWDELERVPWLQQMAS